MDTASQSHSRAQLDPDRFETTVCKVPTDEWLAGFLLFIEPKSKTGNREDRYIVGIRINFTGGSVHEIGKCTGPKHLVRVGHGLFAVGVQLVHFPTGRLARMSLIEQPTRKATMSLRVQDTSGHEYCHFAESHIWANDFPPENARLISHQDFAVSSRPTDQVDDTYETHVLVLGTSEDELADIASISADRCLGGVEVKYHNGPPRVMGRISGPPWTLKLDSRNGERIVHINELWQECVCFQFITNRGRCLVLGSPIHKDPGDDFSNLAKQRLPAGIYMTRKIFDGYSACRGFRTFSMKNWEPLCTNVPLALPQDEHRFCWVPSKPPEEWEEAGIRTGSLRDLEPGEMGLVSWLDCSRPLSSIRVIFVNTNPKGLVAIRFRYTDGEEANVGPDEVHICAEMVGWPGYEWLVREWDVEGKKMVGLKVSADNDCPIDNIVACFAGGLKIAFIDKPLRNEHWIFDESHRGRAGAKFFLQGLQWFGRYMFQSIGSVQPMEFKDTARPIKDKGTP
ncbi:hypothetical protein S40293_10767 [Stachybotrys chartarum IBT 40293]|nr:hypothetical protein S40293_10767 [Stachybotrys chartarum IBT 40293]